MKALFTVLLLCIAHLLAAQKDSVYLAKETVEAGQYKKSKKYKYIDHSLFERRTLFKLSFPVQSFSSAEARESFSIEQKVWPSFSVELGGVLPENGDNAIFSTMRYYPAKRRGAKDSRDKINNFTGNYFSVGLTRGFASDLNFFCSCTFGDEFIYEVGYGRQQKLGKWGFYNLGLGLQYRPEQGTLSLGFNVHSGGAFGKPQDPYPASSKYEDFKKKYTTGSTIFRVSDLTLSAWNISEAESFGSSISLSVEQQILNNFSLLATMDLGISAQEFHRTEGGIFPEHRARMASLSLQTRYYYNRKKRLRMGANLGSFTGHYMAVLLNDLYFAGHAELATPNEKESRTLTGFDQLDIGLVWGIQERFGRRGFFDVQLGIIYEMNERDLMGVGTTGLNSYSSASVGIFLGK